MVEYLSMGAGPPSVALMILNAWGDITPKAEIIMWADTGWEKAETYEHLPAYQDFAAEMGMEWVGVQAKEGPLQDYIREKSIPIPVHTEKAIGHRRCTDKWKIAPIEQELHRRYGKIGLIAQLAMTIEEVHRVRDPRVKRNKNRWPLIEKKLTRQDCIEIITMAGLSVPPYSACLGCPLQNGDRWRYEASNHPEDFAKAVEMDGFLRERAEREGKPPVWLHWSRRPLGAVYSADQLHFPLDNSGEVKPIAECSDGNCFT